MTDTLAGGVSVTFLREESESRLWLAVATSVVGQLRAVALHCGRSCGVGRGLKTGPSQRMQKYDGHPLRGVRSRSDLGYADAAFPARSRVGKGTLAGLCRVCAG